MEGGQVFPSYGQGLYGVIPPRASDIVAIRVLQIELPHHTGTTAGGIFGDSHQILPASNCRLVTTAETNQVDSFCLGKGHFDMLIRERRVHLLHPLLLDGRGATVTADVSSV